MNVFGLIVPDAEHPFAVEVMQDINQAIAELDCDLIVRAGGDVKKESSANRERRYVYLLNTSITMALFSSHPRDAMILDRFSPL